MHKSYYEILGIGRLAGDDEIKRGFRRQALLYHPDRNPDDPEAEEYFGLALEAYQVLKDPRLRRLYDLYGHEGLKSARFNLKTGMEDIFSSFAEVFEGLFSVEAPPKPRPQRGADLKCEVELDLADVARGRQVRVRAPVEVTCPACRGRGHGQGPAELCPDCHGAGRLARQHGFFRMADACPRCHGRGRIYPDECPQCQGRGATQMLRQVPAQVPPGVSDGQTLHLRGQGHPGRNGGEPGDLELTVRVSRHPYFRRNGPHLERTLAVSGRRARAGGQVMLITLNDGLQSLTIPAGAVHGQVLRLAGLGLAGAHGVHGDLLVTLEVGEPPRPPVCLSCARYALRQSPLVKNVYSIYRGANSLRAWALARMDHRELPPAPDLESARTGRRLALILAYLRAHVRKGLAVQHDEAQALWALSRHVEQQAAKNGAGPSPATALAFLDRLHEALGEAELTAAQGGRNGGPLSCGLSEPPPPADLAGLPAVSYNQLRARSQAALADRFLDRYVVNIFAFPRKWLVRRKFLGIMSELFGGIEERAAGGGAIYDVVDVSVSAFVSRHRVLLKSLCLNYSRQMGREVTLYQFESFLAESLRHFYMLLKMHQEEDPLLIRGVPSQLQVGH